MIVHNSMVMTGRLLEGRTAVICGAGRTRGIGLATSRLFAEHGAKVVMLDLDRDEVTRAAATIPEGAAIGVHVDVTCRASCQDAIGEALAWKDGGGRIDALVNCAGITQKRAFMEITAEDFDLVTDINLKGVFNISQAVVPTMRARKSGSIIHISSMSAQQGGGIYGGAHYCGSKAGVLGLVRSLALELGVDNVRANAVTPGMTLTDFSRGRTDEEKQAVAQRWPMKRTADAAEMAGVCLFLASDLSTFVTGATIDVNGGAYMR